jgi:hypothetical protein
MDAVSRRLPPGGDPGQRLVEDLSRVVDRLEAAAEAITAVPAALLKVGETAVARPVEMSGQQVDKLGRQLAAACNAWAGNMVRESQRKSLAIVAGAGVGIALAFFGAGFGVHWWMTPTPPALSCVSNRGGISCGYWLTPPTEPVQTAEQAQQPAPPTKTGRH